MRYVGKKNIDTKRRHRRILKSMQRFISFKIGTNMKMEQTKTKQNKRRVYKERKLNEK